jgi:ubiquinone/menaquinone biosynthesis C-methylase UbiE
LNYRLKLLLFALAALSVLLVFKIGNAAIETLSRLNEVEAERDTWQRPHDVIQALDVGSGTVVADLGCGSGYFTLKLSVPVGDTGRVLAEDIRRLPLMFLWFRARQLRERNVRIIVGDFADPHLPQDVNAVLISNTYHEFTDSHSILVHVYQALVPSGRLVVVDREPKAAGSVSSEVDEHEISAEQVERELRRANFEILARDDQFIRLDSYGETWWLITARKPKNR